jgi:hypothetical protein
MSDIDMSPEEFASLIEDAKKAAKDAETIYREHKETKRKYWRGVFGDELETLLKDRKLVMSRLCDATPEVRLAALSILGDGCEGDEELAVACWALASRDADPRVRSVAIGVYSVCLSRSKDPEALDQLAKIVQDGTKPNGFRKAAYFALFRVADKPLRIWPDPVDFRFPDQVDWDFVKSARHAGNLPIRSVPTNTIAPVSPHSEESIR